jgi:hypothetical protein
MVKKFINLNFFSITFNNIFNLVFPTFFFFILIISKQNILATDIAINSSFLILITRSLTINQRSIAIASNDLKTLDKFIILRLNLIIPILTLGIIFNYLFLNNQKINIIFVILICFQWINEICLIKSELSVKNPANLIFFIINVFFLLFTYLISFFFIEYLFILLLIYLFFNIIFSISFLNKNYLSKSYFFSKKIFQNLMNYFKTYFFLSGFFLNFANFIWKIGIVYIVGKGYASIFFAIFSVGSFPATIFNSSFGPSMVKKRISNLYLVTFYLIYVFFLFLFLFFLLNNFGNFLLEFIFEKSFLVYIFIFTLFGSFIMLYSMSNRQLIIDKYPHFKNIIFKKDILLAFTIASIPFCLYQFGGIGIIGFSYFFAAIISFIFYKTKFFL